MTKTLKASQRILRALDDLLKIQEEPDHLSEPQKEDLKAAIRGLKVEYMALHGVNPKASYKEISGALTSAKSELETIKKERKAFENALVKADKFFKSIGLVLRLIA